MENLIEPDPWEIPNVHRTTLPQVKSKGPPPLPPVAHSQMIAE